MLITTLSVFASKLWNTSIATGSAYICRSTSIDNLKRALMTYFMNSLLLHCIIMISSSSSTLLKNIRSSIHAMQGDCRGITTFVFFVFGSVKFSQQKFHRFEVVVEKCVMNGSKLNLGTSWPMNLQNSIHLSSHLALSCCKSLLKDQ